MATLTTPFGGACDVAINNNYDTIGTLTKATIKGLTPAQVKALFTDGTQWHEMTAMLKTQFEMAACGVRRFGLYDWIMSSNRPGMGKLIQTVKRDRSPSLVQPFIMGRQMSVVNDNYWTIVGGYAAGSYTPGTTGPLSTNVGMDRVIRVVAGYGVPLDSKYFLPRHALYILNVSGSGSALTGQWKVVEAAVSAGADYIDIGLENLNSADTATSDAEPTTGVVLIGINNVHDVEKYCYNPVNVNPVKHVPFFYQTRRRVRQIDSEYKKLFRKLLADNQWFEMFQDLGLAERNRQDELRDQKQLINSFFFGRAWSSAQRLDGSPFWTSLPQVLSLSGASVDPGTGGRLFHYRANMIGIYPQLLACSRVNDMQGQAVNIRTWAETNIYNVYRSRTSQGRPARSIDVYTDSITADEFMVAFINYAKGKLGDIIRINVDAADGQNVRPFSMSEGANEWGFQWRSFRLFRPQGVTVNLITHEFFDDILNTFSTSSVGSSLTRGRFLLTLDMGKGGSIYPAVLGSNRKNYTTGEIEQLAKIDASFACVMENPTIETSMTSENTTAIVECPLHSDWTENFSGVTYV